MIGERDLARLRGRRHKERHAPPHPQRREQEKHEERRRETVAAPERREARVRDDAEVRLIKHDARLRSHDPREKRRRSITLQRLVAQEECIARQHDRAGPVRAFGHHALGATPADHRPAFAVAGAQPFFAYLAFQAVHIPVQAPNRPPCQ